MKSFECARCTFDSVVTEYLIELADFAPWIGKLSKNVKVNNLKSGSSAFIRNRKCSASRPKSILKIK